MVINVMMVLKSQVMDVILLAE
jgi:hypothetical protein